MEGSVAGRLNHLFETVRSPSGKPYSNHQVAEAIDIDHSYISKLRSGDRLKPSFDVVHALAGFFGVRVDYFSDHEVAERTDAQLALLAALRDSGVRDLALRASGLSAAGLNTIAELLDQVREQEGLPPAPDIPVPALEQAVPLPAVDQQALDREGPSPA